MTLRIPSHLLLFAAGFGVLGYTFFYHDHETADRLPTAVDAETTVQTIARPDIRALQLRQNRPTMMAPVVVTPAPAPIMAPGLFANKKNVGIESPRSSAYFERVRSGIEENFNNGNVEEAVSSARSELSKELGNPSADTAKVSYFYGFIMQHAGDDETSMQAALSVIQGTTNKSMRLLYFDQFAAVKPDLRDQLEDEVNNRGLDLGLQQQPQAAEDDSEN